VDHRASGLFEEFIHVAGTLDVQRLARPRRVRVHDGKVMFYAKLS
jgi:hypothetical protein